MKFDGLKPWLTSNSIAAVEVADSDEVYDLHSEWSV